MNHQPEIAIVTQNILMGLGLKSILEKIIPIANVELFTSFEELMEADPTRFHHYFVSYHTYCSHNNFFSDTKRKTILMVDNALQQQVQGVTTININQNEELIVRDILRLHENRHQHTHSISKSGDHPHSMKSSNVLTNREIEVLRLLAKGHINKEIADKLNIGSTTVISHRKSIVAKLGIKSVAGLTVYAITNGFVDIDSL